MPGRSIFIALAAVSLAACTASTDSGAVVVNEDSVLTVDWTVDSTTDPVACADEGADSIDIVVETPGGAPVVEVSDVCEAGQSRIRLAPGDYAGDAVLQDSAGHTITTAVDLGPIRLFGGDDLVVDVDFPRDSFF
ncbi:MAG TPA: hypothetical protein VGQ57_00895 [Polyangiaceae bacterium]|jgi:hypothetical protein|nr:hypothetical protein [Polyangiaceae bacterium]